MFHVKHQPPPNTTRPLIQPLRQHNPNPQNHNNHTKQTTTFHVKHPQRHNQPQHTNLTVKPTQKDPQQANHQKAVTHRSLKLIQPRHVWLVSWNNKRQVRWHILFDLPPVGVDGFSQRLNKPLNDNPPANPTFIYTNTPHPPHKTSFKTRPQSQKISFTSITHVPRETQQLNKLQQPTTFHVKHQPSANMTSPLIQPLGKYDSTSQNHSN